MNAKKNLMKIFVCGAAVLSMGGTAFAATQNTSIIAQLNTETNKARFSTDDGKTWTENAPKDLKGKNTTENTGYMTYKVSEDGKVTVEQNSGTPNVSGDSVMVKLNTKTNKLNYSIDNGKTWTEKAPKDIKGENTTKNKGNMTYKISEDGKVTEEQNNGVPSISKNSVMVKKDKGTQKTVYSIDGGKTWTSKLPNGLK
ncbi:MAG: sialidase family protein [Cellulosilyticaceae bacterium]